MIEFLSTRLFPKGMGADAYECSGIAARCDWVVMSDRHAPHVALRVRNGREAPRHIFVSMRNPGEALRYFGDEVLPRLNQDFVLITGSGDATLPRQTDKRWPAFGARERSLIERIVSHPHLVRWFAENLDDDSEAKLAPLPLGLVFDRQEAAKLFDPFPPVPRLGARPLRALCAHRVRDGAQWQSRRRVSHLAQTAWRDFCSLPGPDLDEAAFVTRLQEHAFVLCVEGGGLDPSPKAWLALLHGGIPIIRDTPLRSAYRHLPVVIISDWKAECVSYVDLAEWRSALTPWFDDPTLRQEVISRLTIDFWWRVIGSGALPSTDSLALVVSRSHG